ncbi:hypothetical protein K502DRAFT_341394 [Neoconidiobolus thromboides FSU 785]|nr:hypothetical protein K502DRAFT_341394 [Neoconidiobolus thromboides FSU 785]
MNPSNPFDLINTSESKTTLNYEDTITIKKNKNSSKSSSKGSKKEEIEEDLDIDEREDLSDREDIEEEIEKMEEMDRIEEEEIKEIEGEEAMEEIEEKEMEATKDKSNKRKRKEEKVAESCQCTFPWDETRVFKFDNSLAIGLFNDEKLVFIGGIKLSVIKGSININGYIQKQSKNRDDLISFIECYNSKSQALYSITAVESEIRDKEDDKDVVKVQEKEELVFFKNRISNVVNHNSTQQEEIKKENYYTNEESEMIRTKCDLEYSSTFDTIIFVNELDNECMKFVDLDNNFKFVFKLKEEFNYVNENSEDIDNNNEKDKYNINVLWNTFIPIIKPQSGLIDLIILNEWESAANEIAEEFDNNNQDNEIPVILICGDKDSGKSTFSKYLTNKFLNKLNEIALINTDPGQSDFTPPGLLSLHLISKPVLGAPFTQLRKSENSYFLGDTHIKNSPEHYLEIVKQLFIKYQQYKENNNNQLPLIINTNGWIKGLGYESLLSVINLIQPNFIIEMDNNNNNTKLITKYNQYKKYYKLKKEENEVIKYYTKYTPEHYRNFNLTCYLLNNNIKLMEKVPYLCNINQYEYYCLNGELSLSQLLFALNLSIVGLYKINEEYKVNDSNNNNIPKLIPHNVLSYPPPEYYNCLGVGLIKNINKVNNEFQLITSLNIEEVKQITTIAIGNIKLPIEHYIENNLWMKVYGFNYLNQGDSIHPPYLIYNPKKLRGGISLGKQSRANILRGGK